MWIVFLQKSLLELEMFCLQCQRAVHSAPIWEWTAGHPKIAKCHQEELAYVGRLHSILYQMYSIGCRICSANPEIYVCHWLAYNHGEWQLFLPQPHPNGPAFPVLLLTSISLSITSNGSREKPQQAQNLSTPLSLTPSMNERQGLAQAYVISLNPHHKCLQAPTTKQGQTSPTPVPSACNLTWLPPKPLDHQRHIQEMLWWSTPQGITPQTPCGPTNQPSMGETKSKVTQSTPHITLQDCLNETWHLSQGPFPFPFPLTLAVLASSMTQLPSLPLTACADNPQLGHSLMEALARPTRLPISRKRGFKLPYSDPTELSNEPLSLATPPTHNHDCVWQIQRVPLPVIQSQFWSGIWGEGDATNPNSAVAPSELLAKPMPWEQMCDFCSCSTGWQLPPIWLKHSVELEESVLLWTICSPLCTLHDVVHMHGMRSWTSSHCQRAS